MATQERLIKSLDSLKTLLASTNPTSDSSLKKKDKILHCNVIGDAMCNSSVKVATNFPNLLSYSVEILLQLCDDPESDVRMIADESLNRIIRAMSNGNIIKIQLELHKEIKKNGSARSLRAALWRFAQLCHMIRPHKGKPYVNNLIPCIVKIAERSEESLHETLANSLPKIMDALGSFTTDNDIKCLLKAFLQNISNPSAVLRRTSATCVMTVCLKCRKPHIFISYVLNTLLDLLIPVINEHSASLILGVLGCLRSILPHIKQTSGDQELKGSFGVKRSLNENSLSPNRMIQVYEICLYYASNADHNIINAALETLNTLLQNAPIELINILLSPEGITRSRITSDISCMRLKHRSLSQISVATTRTLADESTLVDNEITEIKTDIEKWIESAKMPPSSNTSIDSSLNTSTDLPDTLASDNCEYSNIYIGTIEPTYEECEDAAASAANKSKPLEDFDVSDGIASEKSSPKIPHPQDKITEENNVLYQDVDIGCFTDSAVPLDYCCRFIAKSFLLTGHPDYLIPDKSVRISVKSLALSCISSILTHYPNVFLMYLDKNRNDCAKNDSSAKMQQISDVLLFSDHGDPQLRGNVNCLIGNFIKSVIVHSESDYDCWLAKHTQNQQPFQLKHLMQIFIKSLQDESSTCCRLSLIGIGTCMTSLIESVNSLTFLPVLNLLPTLVKNPYWLVKVKLVEIICEIPFLTLQFISGNCEFQDKIIHNILFKLLTDEDQRVRHASAAALVKIVKNLYHAQDLPNQSITTTRAIHYKNKYLKNLFNTSLNKNVYENRVLRNLPEPYNHLGSEANYTIEQSLSRIITHLSQVLLNPTSKYIAYGSSEALYLLSNEYPTTQYFQAWNCNRPKVTKHKPAEIFQRSFSQTCDSPDREILEHHFSCASGLLHTCITLLTTTTVSHEITCHQWLLNLAGNIFSGISVHNFKSSDELNPDSSTKEMWDMYADKLIAEVTEQFLHHIVRLLNIFCHIIDETLPQLPQAKPVLSNLPSATNLSPIKRRSKSDAHEKKTPVSKFSADKDDKSDKKGESSKFNAMGYFANLPHYMKFYEILRMAHTNYKITLDSDASEKFLQLLKTSLDTLSQLLEMSSVNEMGRIAEELLFYLRSTVSLEATSTIHCVLQLLKCLFGTNLCFQINDISIRSKTLQDLINVQIEKSDFYYNIFQSMYENLTESIETIKKSNKIEMDNEHSVMGYLHRKDRKANTSFKSLSRTADKTALANYIRLFEPMVIKALKQYTITSDVRLQCIVLRLLSHLVQLRVNYCLLDSDQIFIGYVLKQFEFIEEGQIPLAEELIPRIFQFLVHLSYEKQHSKSIMNVPKIIHLCDGLMASGQSPLTHFIPAIIPVIEDIFIFRNQNNTVTDLKELETTRDVLFSMLLRLVEYPQVIQLLALVVNESKYCNDNGERWNRWSKQIAEILLPVMGQNRVRLENAESQTALYNLIVSLNPIVFKPITGVLKVLFSEPPSKQNTSSANSPSTRSVNYWLGMILTLSMTISQVKEDVLLMRINEVQSEFAARSVFDVSTNEISPDPLNVSNPTHLLDAVAPPEIFARFIFRVVHVTSEKCCEIFNDEGHCDNYIFEQFSVFLIYCIHMFQSGSHCKIANAAINLISNNTKTDGVQINRVNDIILKLAPFCPSLTLEWCYLLTLLNYNEKTFWSTILQTPKCDGIVHLSPDELSKTNQKTNCINLEIVKVGGTILYCDYLCENISDAEQLTWLLVNHIEYIIRLSNEVPVSELIATIHRNSAASGLFIQAIGARCQDIIEPCFINKLLRSVENAHPSQSGALLLLIIPRLLNCRQLSLSRFASSLASRVTELLLTMTMEEVQEQLPKDDLMIIINNLLKAKIIKKHETLVSLLNRLGSKCYDLSPIEFDQRRNLNPENIKNIVVNKNWYLSQVKNHCNQTTYSGKESAELLNKLEYEDILSIMSNIDFNNSILKDCIILVKHSNNDLPLLNATIITLLNHIAYIKSLIPKPHQVYKVCGREILLSEQKYIKRVDELFADNTFWSTLDKVIPTVTCYLESLPDLPHTKISDNHFEDFAKFGVLCLESIVYQIKHENRVVPNFLDVTLNCVDVIYKQHNFCSILGLDSYCSWLCSAVNAIYFLVEYLLLSHEPMPSLPTHGLRATLDNMETVAAGHACYQLSVMVAWIKQTQNNCTTLPQFLFEPIRSIVISLARLPLVNSYILTPPNAWIQGWQVDLTGTFSTHVPPLPIDFLQEIEVLEEFIFRITLLGWTSRQQFEETWMCLLSVLSASPTEDSMPDEVASMVHSTSVSVQAITALLLQTLLAPVPGDPHVSQLIHVPRDGDIDCKAPSLSKLKVAHEALYWKYEEYAKQTNAHYQLNNIFRKRNFERTCAKNYSYSQVSIEYLWTTTKIAENTAEASTANRSFVKRQMYLQESGLDLHSCLQFLLDLYTQWLKPQNNTPLRLLQEVVKSILVLSDIFTEKSQYIWMLDVYTTLSKTHPIEDDILHQYLIVGICKATAVLTPDLDTFDQVKKMVATSLKSGFLPAKIASLHGILYLLQSSVIGNTIIGGLSEEIQLIHPIAIDYIQYNINSTMATILHQCEEHQLIMWAMAFYLLENVEEQISDTDIVPSVLQVALNLLSQNIPHSIHNALMQGLERLIVKKCISGKVIEQVIKIALDKLKHTNPNYALPGLQLLLTCMYIDSQEQLNSENTEGVAQTDPERFVQMIERISALFDRIKKSCPFEVELLCSVLPNVLIDFFPPSEILTKVIGEFLSPQQPHPKILSGIVFLVFEKACDKSQLLLLQDWVVCSLSNFTQSLPVGMATWCLTCFFISASTNAWLRSLFPYIQSRIGRYEYDDKKMLCIAAADFYRTLSNQNQRDSFLETFNKVKHIPGTPFNDLLACL